MNARNVCAPAVVVAALMVTAGRGEGTVSTAFTFQGQLKNAGVPVNTTVDFEFCLTDDPVEGIILAGPVRVDDLSVHLGLFTVRLDFGSNVFDGNARFLEVRVRDGALSGPAPFETLLPRQPLTPVPYAIRALNDQVGGIVLPFDATINDPADALRIVNTFPSETSVSGRALVGIANGLAPGVYAENTGNGPAAQFQDFTAGNTSNTVDIFTTTDGTSLGVKTTGNGSVATFEIANFLNQSPVISAVGDGCGPTIKVLATGSGSAATFEIDNNFLNDPAVLIESNGLEAALKAISTNTGSAGHFETQFIGGTATTLSVMTTGNGDAVEVEKRAPSGHAVDLLTSNNTNADSTFQAVTRGRGPAGKFLISVLGGGPMNASPALTATTNGTGPAARFKVNPPGNTTNAIEVTTVGSTCGGYFRTGPVGGGVLCATIMGENNLSTGSAAAFISNDPTNGAATVNVSHEGLGSAAVFSTSGLNAVGNTNATILASTNQTNSAGEFRNLNTASSATTLSVISQGLGRVAEFVGTLNFSVLPVIYAESNGFGAVAHFNDTGTMQSLAPAVRIDANGTGTFGAGLEINHSGTGPAFNVKQTGGGTLGTMECASQNAALTIKNTAIDGIALRLEGNATVVGDVTVFGAGNEIVTPKLRVDELLVNPGLGAQLQCNAPASFTQGLTVNFDLIANANVIVPGGNVNIGGSGGSGRLNVCGDVNVDGVVIADGLVELDVGVCADFVFEPDYPLMPLRQLQRYLQENKHLPNIPSASEVRANGIRVGEFQMRLLQKIEELTLYTIEQQHRNERLTDEVAPLREVVRNSYGPVPASALAATGDANSDRELPEGTDVGSVDAGGDLSNLQSSVIKDFASELVALRARTDAGIVRLERRLTELTRAMGEEE